MTPARRVRSSLAASSLALALAAMTAVAACTAPAPPTVAPRTPVAEESPITGRLVKLESDGLTKVRGFTMRLDDGSEVAFTMGPVDNAADFPPGHLAEHMATSDLVRVYYRDESGARVVYRLEDGE